MGRAPIFILLHRVEFAGLEELALADVVSSGVQLVSWVVR